MRAYRELLATPEARWPLITSTIHRLTPGMVILAMVLLLIARDRSFTVAGLVTAAHQIGVAVASPIQGKLADRFGPPRVLVPDGVLYLLGTVVFVVAVEARPAAWILVVIAVIAGVVFPPTTACSRVVLSRLFPTGQLRTTAFAVSTIAVELGFIVGPLTAVAIADLVGAEWAVVGAGLAAAIGALGFAATGAARDIPRRERTSDVWVALRSPGIRVMVVAIGTIAIAFGVFDIVVPAYADLIDEPRAAGLIAAIAAGSALGGLVYGSRSWPGDLVQQLCVLTMVFAGGFFLLPVAVVTLPAFAVGLFLSGLFLGPTLIAAFQLIDDLALRGTQTEAQQWTQATVLTGVAAGAMLAGVGVDRFGPAAAFLGGATCVALGGLSLILRRDRLVPVTVEHDSAAPVVAPPVHLAPPLTPEPRPAPQVHGDPAGS